MKSAACPQQISKTVIFCLTKDSCHSVYVHLWKNVSLNKRCWFGIYHASMSEAGKSANQERFKQGHMCVMIATSAFGLGVDVSDITSVILYGCPLDGLMYSQLSGRGGRNHDLHCVCLLLYSPGEVKDADSYMQTACSEEVCIRELLVKSVLESTEDLDANLGKCCSVCNSGVMPVMYLPCAGSVQSSAEKQPCTQAIRRLKADQKAQLKKELMALRSCLAENQFLMRGQCAVIPVQIVDKIVKNSSRVTKLDDLVLLGVSCAVAQKVLEVLNRVTP